MKFHTFWRIDMMLSMFLFLDEFLTRGSVNGQALE